MTLTAETVRAYDDRAPDPADTETASFGLGCFWGPDAQFGALEGVVRTRVGYAGGTTPDPTYHDLGDHTETVQVDYDPEATSYDDLLEVWYRTHDPSNQPRKTQYQNLVLTASERQRNTLGEFLTARGLTPDAIETRVETLSQFTVAEDYHQKHDLGSRRAFLDAFDEAGYDDQDRRESPAAAKVNGYLAGHDLPTGDGLRTVLNAGVPNR